MTDKLVQGNFKISQTTNGGIIGQSEISYEFLVEGDSVQVEIIHHFVSPKDKFEVMIGLKDFEQIKSNIICLSELHVNGEPIHTGCQPPFESLYVITSKLSKVRIYPGNQDSCQFVYLLPEYDPQSTWFEGN